MDSMILHLFAMDEILERLSNRRLTGCLHIFTAEESANIFFRDGLIVAANKGQLEGEEVLSQVLKWESNHYLWQPEAVTPPSSCKPQKILIHDFLARHEKNGTGKKSSSKEEGAPGSNSVISIPAKGKSTSPLATNATLEPKATPTTRCLTATKTFSLSNDDRVVQDEELLRRYPLVLVSIDAPEKRFKIVQVNNLAGRNPACDLTIPHSSISRQHCLLQLTDRGLHVKDLNTTNGTRVNGIVLKEGYVSAGDRLTIGHVHFRVEQE